MQNLSWSQVAYFSVAPPGGGKTLLAKAVVGANFFSIPASQFVEIYVGFGASRVRSLYQEAKDNVPSVVFIDELDAVGRERGLRVQVDKNLLVCWDGFEGRGNVITVASANRADILDPAPVRPGWFDRKINFIPKPGLIVRMEILYIANSSFSYFLPLKLLCPCSDDVDYLDVANMTDGMVGTELANIVEVAAINMLRDGRTEITMDDLLQAPKIEERGKLDSKERSTETWRQVGINEAAMAVVVVNFPDLKNIQFACSRVPIARTAVGNPCWIISVQLAACSADELWYGKGQMYLYRVMFIFYKISCFVEVVSSFILVHFPKPTLGILFFIESFQLSTISAETARSAARTFVLGGLSDNHFGYLTSGLKVDIKLVRIEMKSCRPCF
ncbi:putative inactive ATP-dependent zinc metalloprotease FTSHI 2 [Citrus sinensis]|uniref:Inactive ATP-dependent zinc metalloprotease FTSHI 2 n=1 Tax=Citrus sinensis TaxID=2711 RepID=A0ACB8K8I3_CITSI|nr:putative inactive ATP-dependent zinc metalloprotease FTSHI 2 [Citrus sinensis]